MTAVQFQAGDILVYDDGRPGHRAKASVISVGPDAMLVQFDDRADTTTIKFSESVWMDYISKA